MNSLISRRLSARYGQLYDTAAVGEIHVVEKMRACGAVIGGEGNGGVIYPTLHAGRDALVATALFLTHLAKKGIKASALRKQYPNYYIHKRKIPIPPREELQRLLKQIAKQYRQYPQQNIDGLRIDFPKKWVHLRPSNTEPILRIYAEAESKQAATDLAETFAVFLKGIT